MTNCSMSLMVGSSANGRQVVNEAQRDMGKAFKDLHSAEGIFVMPNAWNAGGACMLEAAGFPAVGTTSAGIAFSLGLPDYEGALDRESARLFLRYNPSCPDCVRRAARTARLDWLQGDRALRGPLSARRSPCRRNRRRRRAPPPGLHRRLCDPPGAPAAPAALPLRAPSVRFADPKAGWRVEARSQW